MTVARGKREGERETMGGNSEKEWVREKDRDREVWRRGNLRGDRRQARGSEDNRE